MYQFYRKLLATLVILSVSSATAFAQVDAEQVSAWMRKNDCFKCHAVDKVKVAPAYRTIAQKYAGDSEASSKIIQHLRSGRTVTLTSGLDVAHKIVGDENPALTDGLVAWILAQ